MPSASQAACDIRRFGSDDEFVERAGLQADGVASLAGLL
jgi:hypothetical protein